MRSGSKDQYHSSALFSHTSNRFKHMFLLFHFTYWRRAKPKTLNLQANYFRASYLIYCIVPRIFSVFCVFFAHSPCLVFLYSLEGRELAWQFLQDNWDELYNRYASGLLLPRLIQVNWQYLEHLVRRQINMFVLCNKPLYVTFYSSTHSLAIIKC